MTKSYYASACLFLLISANAGCDSNDSSQIKPRDQQSQKQSSNAQTDEKRMEEMAKKIVEEGPCSMPGMGPDPNHPDNVVSYQRDRRERTTVRTKAFSVGPRWRIVWKAGPFPTNDIGFLNVDLFLGADKEKRHPQTIIYKQFEPPSDPVRRLKEREGKRVKNYECDNTILTKGGEYYLETTSNIPFDLDVRRQ